MASSTLPDTASRKGTRARRSPLRYLGAAVFTVVTALAILPDLLFELDRRTPFAQLVAFRPFVMAGAGLVLVLLLLITVFSRRALPFAAGLAAVLAVGAVMVGLRVVADPAPTEGTPITVLTFNALDYVVDGEDLAQAAQRIRVAR
jgi:hypothetical protein